MDSGADMEIASDARVVFRISGKDCEAFLQNLVTNDVNRDGLVYAALLTPQGKYLADFFLLRDGDGFLLDVADPIAASLSQRLAMYRLRADVQIAPANLYVSRGVGAPPDGAVIDPRAPSMGWRVYSETPMDSQSEDWIARRVTACIPQTAVELIPNETYPLEAGFERLSGIDFRKGCYVGQEVTARMKHKTELKKGFVTVSVSGTAPVGTAIQSDDGRAAGTLYSQSNGKGIAYLRFDRAKGEMTAGDAAVKLIG